jgi:hypothetical protein
MFDMTEHCPDIIRSGFVVPMYVQVKLPGRERGGGVGFRFGLGLTRLRLRLGLGLLLGLGMGF